MEPRAPRSQAAPADSAGRSASLAAPSPRPAPSPSLTPSPTPQARAPASGRRPRALRPRPGTWSDMVTVDSPGGLRTTAASGRQNRTLRFTNPSLLHSTTPRLQGLPLRLASLPLRAEASLGRRERKRENALGKAGGEILKVVNYLPGAREPLGLPRAGEPGPLPQPLGRPALCLQAVCLGSN